MQFVSSRDQQLAKSKTKEVGNGKIGKDESNNKEAAGAAAVDVVEVEDYVNRNVVGLDSAASVNPFVATQKKASNSIVDEVGEAVEAVSSETEVANTFETTKRTTTSFDDRRAAEELENTPDSTLTATTSAFFFPTNDRSFKVDGFIIG